MSYILNVVKNKLRIDSSVNAIDQANLSQHHIVAGNPG